MKKVVMGLLISMFIVACSASEMEQTKETKYNYDTTYEQLLSEYKFAEQTEWKKEDESIQANSLINIEDANLQIDQYLIFEDKELQEIVWEFKNKSIVLTGSKRIKEVLNRIYNQKPLMKRKNASDKLKDKMEGLFDKYKDKAQDRIEDEIRDLF